MKLLDYSDPIVEFKKLNIEDKNGSREDEDDPIHNISDCFNNLNINNRELTERGKAKKEQNLEIKNNKPYQKDQDCGRRRNDSVDSGHYSDGSSVNSPSSSRESIITSFHENDCKPKLVSLEGWQEKIEDSPKLSLVQCETVTRVSTKNHIEEQRKHDLVSNKNVKQKKSAIISNSETKISNLENYHNTATSKKILEEQLNPLVLRQKWLDLIVFSKEDIFETDPEGLTIFHRLLNNPEDDELPEALYTVMEEFKQHPYKCKVLLNSKDAILNSLQSVRENTELLDYFRISFIVISMLYDFYKEKGTDFSHILNYGSI